MIVVTTDMALIDVHLVEPVPLRYKPGVKDTATGILTPRSCKKCELTPHLGKFTQYKILINL